MSLLRDASRWALKLLVAWTTFGLTASGCATVSKCTTTCGFRADEVPVGWTCQDVQDVESAIIRELQSAKDDRLKKQCDLSRFQLLVVHAEDWWSFGRQVQGLTYCENGNVIIGNSLPKDSALAHEIVHALQNCTPLEPYNDKDLFHSNWKRDGLYDAIDRATASLDGGN